MPSATMQFTGPGISSLVSGGTDWDGSALKAGLANTAFSPNMDTLDFWNDVNASNEVTGTNWAAGGQALTGLVVNVDTANNEVELRANDVSVSTVTLTDGKHLIIYNSSPGTDATRPVLAYGTFDVALAPQGGTLLLDFNATEGLGKFTY